MNSVANQNVATLMNSNFGTHKSNTNLNHFSKKEFSKVYNHEKNIQQLDKKQFEALRNEKMGKPSNAQADKGAVNKDRDLSVDQREKIKPMNETVKKASNSTTKEESIEETSELETVTKDMIMVDYSALEQMALTIVSELLGIPEASLQMNLETMDMNVFDLLNMNSLSELLGNVFQLEETTLLTHGEAFESFKAIQTELKALLESVNMSEEEVLDAMNHLMEGKTLVAENQVVADNQLVAANGEIPSSTIAKELDDGQGDKQEVKLEVHDLRSQKVTTQYDQKETSKQKGDQSFSTLFSQNTTDLKEVVVVNKAGEVKYQQVSTNDIINQIVTKAIVNLSDTRTSMNLQLNPGNLGKIAISVVAEQGLVKGQFVAENEVVKQMIESNIGQLKSQLEQQGIKVDKIEVTLGNANLHYHQKEQSDQRQSYNKTRQDRINRLNRLHNIEVVQPEIKSTEISKDMDGNMEHTVEYSA
ncbi:flagellar hook-length control protein FliK [Petrocella sp. FN5]|uniref:flagellar hook-length control protein FliK n=1 Tax=Petrocella sp. FN5 TaxID=3032002 RepID=UPI0023DC9D36|nr:flagellar hook-length control protein FliK [Petrocella sp. FN5]MDF1616826.1 flagellar hook-length control protein FliK [Petrocella sp. FN5]